MPTPRAGWWWAARAPSPTMPPARPAAAGVLRRLRAARPHGARPANLGQGRDDPGRPAGAARGRRRRDAVAGDGRRRAEWRRRFTNRQFQEHVLKLRGKIAHLDLIIVDHFGFLFSGDFGHTTASAHRLRCFGKGLGAGRGCGRCHPGIEFDRHLAQVEHGVTRVGCQNLSAVHEIND